MSNIVYLNGQFLNEEEALISPNDRGFIFADGVYEVIKYYNGKPFRFEDHLQRLKRSLNELELDFSAVSEMENVFQSLLKQK